MEQQIESSSWHSYPKIYNLGHRAVQEIFNEPVVIEEKVDGSQFSFGQFNEELRVRSKGAEITPDAPPKLFGRCVETARALHQDGRLPDGWTFRGECLDKPKHNALAYDRVPEGNVILFDINTGYESYASPKLKQEIAHENGLEVVPVLFEGTVAGPELVRELLARVSILGGQLIEGVVIKNYQRFTIEKTAMLAKYVSEGFKEVHKREWKQSNPNAGDIIEQLIEQNKTEARWRKAVQHLLEAGVLDNSPKDIGALIAEVKRDTFTEERDEMIRKLMKWAQPKIERGIVAGLPEWYKQRLLDLQFEEVVLG